MTTFLLSAHEAGSRIGNMVAFLLSFGASGSEHFSLFLFFIYLAFFFISFLKLPVGVSGSVPEREHDHLFALCRRVGLGPGLKTCRGGALSRIGNWPLLFAPPCDGV